MTGGQGGGHHFGLFLQQLEIEHKEPSLRRERGKTRSKVPIGVASGVRGVNAAAATGPGAAKRGCAAGAPPNIAHGNSFILLDFILTAAGPGLRAGRGIIRR